MHNQIFVCSIRVFYKEKQHNNVINSVIFLAVNEMLNKNTLGVKKVRGQSEAALQIGMCDQKL